MRCLACAIAVLAGTPVWSGIGAGDSFLHTVRSPYATFESTRYMRYAPGFAARRAMFDRLGQFVNYGTYGLQWDEIRDAYSMDKSAAGISAHRMDATSRVWREPVFFRTLSTLAIVRHGYRGRYMGMMVGRNISTTFTPLVFHQMHFGGLRVDYGSRNQDFTWIMSRGGHIEQEMFSNMYGTLQGQMELSPVLLMGANWRRHLGALRLGAAHVRQVQTNLKSSSAALLHGDVPYPELQSPRILIVRVTDDDPEVPWGAAVHGAHITFTGTTDTGPVRYTSSPDLTGDGVLLDARLEPRISGRRDGVHWVAEGAGETIDITFELPPEMVGQEAEISVLVDGDYRISVRQLHDFRLPGTASIQQRSWPSPPPVAGTYGVYFKDYTKDPEPFYTVRRAPGRPQPDGQPREVRFRHGIPTAQSFWSANLQVTTERLSLVGEFVFNPQTFQFPTSEGGRETRLASAGYLNALVPLAGLGALGAEVFRLEPTYGGWYDSRRGGLVLFTDAGGDVFATETRGRDAYTQEFRLYDDNDDHDNWADDLINFGDALYVPTGAYDRPIFLSSRPEGGVYPGYDMDGDLVLDFDKNRNGIMDWLEPFLGFDADPPEFVYGMDFNNNLVPDYRENDDHPNYPYRRDREGVHLFYDAGWRPWWLSLLRVGWHHTREIAAGGTSRALYARVRAYLETPSLWLTINDDLKRVQDDIPDDVYRLILSLDRDVNMRWNRPTMPPPRDFLPMRNSLVNTFHVASGWFPLNALVLENSVKYLINRRLDHDDDRGMPIQQAETIHHISMVNKVSYRHEISRRLSLVCRGKHLWARWDEGSYTPVLDSLRAGEEASWSLLTPELLVAYRLTPKTEVHFGQHGFFVPFMRARYIDRLDDARDYQADISIIQVTMRGVHYGYNMATSVGLRRERKYFAAAAERDDRKLSAFFVDLIFGPE